MTEFADSGSRIFEEVASSKASVCAGRHSVFFLKCPCKIGLVAETAVCHDVNYLKVCFFQLLCSQLQAVIYQIGVEAHAGEFFKQLHKMTLREAALICGFFYGNLPVIEFLDIIERVFQPAVGELQAAGVNSRSGALPVYEIEKAVQIRFDHQFVGGIAFLSVLQYGQDAGRDCLVKAGFNRIEAVHCPFSAQKGEDIFLIAKVIFGSLKQGRMKQNIKIVSLLGAVLFDRMHGMGKYNDKVFLAERIYLAPYGNPYPPLGAVNQFKVVVPVKRKRGNPFGDASAVDTAGKRDGSVNFCFVQRGSVH